MRVVSHMRNLLLLAVLGLLCLGAGCKARTPGAFERGMATRVKQKLTVGGKSQQNPFPATETNIREGQARFLDRCMVCHGADGENTGVAFADRMSPPVPLLTSPEVQGYTDGQLKWVIENGIFPSGMPAWKGTLDDAEMWKIVEYIRHLPANGGPPVPDANK